MNDCLIINPGALRKGYQHSNLSYDLKDIYEMITVRIYY